MGSAPWRYIPPSHYNDLLHSPGFSLIEYVHLAVVRPYTPAAGLRMALAKLHTRQTHQTTPMLCPGVRDASPLHYDSCHVNNSFVPLSWSDLRNNDNLIGPQRFQIRVVCKRYTLVRHNKSQCSAFFLQLSMKIDTSDAPHWCCAFVALVQLCNPTNILEVFAKIHTKLIYLDSTHYVHKSWKFVIARRSTLLTIRFYFDYQSIHLFILSFICFCHCCVFICFDLFRVSYAFYLLFFHASLSYVCDTTSYEYVSCNWNIIFDFLSTTYDIRYTLEGHMLYMWLLPCALCSILSDTGKYNGKANSPLHADTWDPTTQSPSHPGHRTTPLPRASSRGRVSMVG